MPSHYKPVCGEVTRKKRLNVAIVVVFLAFRLPLSVNFLVAVTCSAVLLCHLILTCIVLLCADHGFTYSALLLAILFLYMEVSQRLTSLPVNMVNISRPFAAHW